MAAAALPPRKPNPKAMTLPPDPGYSDRKTGLVVFGIAEMLLGFFCALAVPMLLIGQIFARRGPEMPHPPPVLPVLTMYALMAVAFIWLGIGSILARRWARAILLCLSAVALCGGAIGSVALSFVMPRILDTIAQNSPQPIQPGAMVVVKVVAMGVIFFMYIVIPGALFLFYRSPHVKRTCELRDPVERWTDRCPLPVLAMCLLMGLGSVAVLGLLGGSRGFPFFGTVVTGGSRLLLMLLFAALFLYLARGFYLLRIPAWWLALALLVVGLASNLVTFWGTNMGDTYLKMGIDPRAAALAGQFSSTPAFKWLTLIWTVPWLLWVLYVRRYFGPRKAEAAPVLTESAPPLL